MALRFTASVLLVALLARTAPAVLVIPYSLAGTYHAAGGYSNDPAFENYRVGLGLISTTPEHRNFFIFDLTLAPVLPMGSVVGGFVKLYLPKFAPPDLLDPGFGYISAHPSETFRLTAPLGFSADDLADTTHTPTEASMIYDALGTGPALVGELEIFPTDMGTMVAIPLTPMALGAINGALGTGMVAMGGRMTTLSGELPDELLFAFTDLWKPHMDGKDPILELISVAVPESGGGTLVGVVAIGACAASRFRRTKARSV